MNGTCCHVCRRGCLQLAALAVVISAIARSDLAAETAAQQVASPSFLYVFSDQQHWRAMGFQDPFFVTPHLDQLAADATVLERAFCSTPQCSPSRSSMMTGLYPSKTGVMGNVGAAGGKKLDVKTVGAMLQEAGYYTAYYGKWHLGNDPKGTAGWNETAWEQPDRTTTAKGVGFLKSDRAQRGPFALVLSYLNPHDVYQFQPTRGKAATHAVPLPKSWYEETFNNKPPVQRQFMTDDQGKLIWGADPQVWQAYREFYREKLRLYDEGLGEVLAALKAAGLWEKTIVIVSSDHGDMDTHHRLIFKGPLMYEQMIRIPMIIRVPKVFGGVRRGRISDYDTVNVDLVPTLRDFAGLQPIACDGLSLRPLLTGASSPPKRDSVICQYYGKQQWVNPIRTIRTAQFKYTKYLGDGEELYDLTKDPDELVNLAGQPEFTKVKQRLAAELDQWIKANSDPFYSLKAAPLKKAGGAARSNDR